MISEMVKCNFIAKKMDAFSFDSKTQFFFVSINYVALTLLETRAYSMQQASLEVGGGMMTMLTSHESKLGLAKEAAQKYCKSECGISDPVIQTASYLTPYHKVVAGHNEVGSLITRLSLSVVFLLAHLRRKLK